MRHAVLLLSLLMLVLLPPRADAQGTRRALLVGCTDYPQLGPRYHLEGCGNDVLLMRELLSGEKFAFPRANVKILSEEEGEKNESNRPTRAHIEREFHELARIAGPGDKVVVFLAGHGSQQPCENPDDAEHPEPDGLDEIFLPSDVRRWDVEHKKVVNAITDKEIAVWLKAIRARGASLVVIVDACHAATLVRDREDALPRGIPIDKLVPEEAIRQAREKAARGGAVRTRGGESDRPWKMAGEEPDLAALYAAQSSESAYEDWAPDRDSPGRKKHGVFTYALAQVLTQSAHPLTYAEVIQRIHARVRTRTCYSLPLVEGKDRDREFLGEHQWPGRSRFLLRKRGDDYLLNAGSLHGFNPGTILEVRPPAGAGEDRIIGHIEVVEARVLDATVRSIAYGKLAENRALPEQGRCQPVYLQYGSLQLPVALDGAAPNAVRQALEQLSKKAGGSLLKTTTPDRAEWLIHCAAKEVTLVPAGPHTRDAAATTPRAVGPAAIDDELPAWLDDRLTRIARARNLLGLAATLQDEGGDTLRLAVELVRFPPELPARAENAVRVPWTGDGLRLTTGEQFAFRICNQGRFAVWATLLYIDSGYGISAYFPRSDRVDNRIGPGQVFTSPRAKVVDRTLGLEHVVVLAVKADIDQDGVDFTWLCQPTLEQARSELRGDSEQTIDSPLGRLLQTAAFAHGGTRGLRRDVSGDTAVRLLSFQTLPKESPARRVEVAPTVEAQAAPPPIEDIRSEFPWTMVLGITVGLIVAAALLLLWNRHRPAAKGASKNYFG
jgi:hypothetical protein